MKTKSLARDKVGKYTISTIRIDSDKMPIQYETMVFEKIGKFTGGLGVEAWSSTWNEHDEALKGHEGIVSKLKEGWRP